MRQTRMAKHRGKVSHFLPSNPVNLQSTNFSPFSTQKEGPDEAMARVPVKRLIDLTSGDQLKPTRCILNILDSQLIHCFLLVGVDINLQFLIPNVQNI